MKSGTESLIKFKRLKRRLGLRHWQCVGLLEALWLATRSNAYLGDIGKLSNEDIAAALEWDSDADELVEALVDTEWLDRDEQFRLIVHHWSQHCPTYLKGAAEKHKAIFADVAAQLRQQPAKQVAMEPAKHVAEQPCIAAPPNLTKPNLTKPNLTNPTQPFSSSANAAGGERRVKFSDEEMALARFVFERVRVVVPNHKTPNLDNWANEIRLMRRDGEDRTLEGIRQLFVWANSDSFWKSNILSPAKLREKWDQLQARRLNPNGNIAQTTPGDGQRHNPQAELRWDSSTT
jgi:hypothetical protein